MHDTASSPNCPMDDLLLVPCTQRGTVLDSRPWAAMVDTLVNGSEALEKESEEAFESQILQDNSFAVQPRSGRCWQTPQEVALPVLIVAT